MAEPLPRGWPDWRGPPEFDWRKWYSFAPPSPTSPPPVPPPPEPPAGQKPDPVIDGPYAPLPTSTAPITTTGECQCPPGYTKQFDWCCPTHGKPGENCYPCEQIGYDAQDSYVPPGERTTRGTSPLVVSVSRPPRPRPTSPARPDRIFGPCTTTPGYTQCVRHVTQSGGNSTVEYLCAKPSVASQTIGKCFQDGDTQHIYDGSGCYTSKPTGLLDRAPVLPMCGQRLAEPPIVRTTTPGIPTPTTPISFPPVPPDPKQCCPAFVERRVRLTGRIIKDPVKCYSITRRCAPKELLKKCLSDQGAFRARAMGAKLTVLKSSDCCDGDSSDPDPVFDWFLCRA